jgi:predicted lipid-binding transport protein (Tim44 family)
MNRRGSTERGRMRRRRTAAVLALVAAVLVATLIVVPDAFASAGGGSSGFSGGGGGGGGGGRGAGLYIVIQILIRIAVFGHGLGALILVGVILLVVMFNTLVPKVRNFATAQQSSGRQARRRTAHRERRVALAAAEASEDDPAFAPDLVKPAAARLFKDIQSAWDAGNRMRLSELISRDLATEWERRLDDLQRKGWHNRVQLLGEPSVQYVGLTNRGDDAGDRVVVRIDAKMRDYVEDHRGHHIKRTGRLSETVTIREFWTLGKRNNKWILLSIEQGAEGAHALEQQIVATPWSDEQAMHDEALLEGAVADAVPAGTSIAEVADLDFRGDARAAALDLSLADGRFAPDVLAVAARRAVAAWAEAVDGNDAALKRLARDEAVLELLHPGDPGHGTRLVVRGLTVQWIRIVGLDAGATPPTMTIEIDLEGRRYIEDRDTAAVISGSQSRATRFTERWTLALEGDAREPWRIAAVETPLPSA